MFDSLLVPVDDTPSSERIIPVVAAIAQAVGVGIEFLTIDSPEVERGSMALYQERLCEALPDGVPGRGTIVLGDAPVAELLLDAYRARPSALLALATRAPGTLWQWLSGGSIGDDVVHETLRPVLLTGPQCDTATAALTITAHTSVALDGTELDDQVMAAAVGWSRSTRTRLTLLRVVTTPTEPCSHRDAAADVERRAAEARRHGIDVQVDVIDAGDPGRAILRHVTATGGLLIVGSHRRSPIGRVLQGSNALWLVHRAPVPVLVAGFSVAPAAAGGAPAAAVDVTDARFAFTTSTAAQLVGWSDHGAIAV